jgi:hypothetical protein
MRSRFRHGAMRVLSDINAGARCTSKNCARSRWKDAAMPRYYFPATDGRRNLADDGGLVLPSDEAARLEARSIATELLDPQDGAGVEAWKNWRIQVRDAAGRLISEVALTNLAATTA